MTELDLFPVSDLASKKLGVDYKPVLVQLNKRHLKSSCGVCFEMLHDTMEDWKQMKLAVKVEYIKTHGHYKWVCVYCFHEMTKP